MQQIRRLARRLRVDGKRATAERVVREAAVHLRRRGYERPYAARLAGLRARAPVRGRRTEKRGWKKFPVPTALSPEAQRKEGRRRLRDTLREASGAPAAEVLAREFHLALRGAGVTRDKRLRAQKQAVQGRAGLGPIPQSEAHAARKAAVEITERDRSPRSFQRLKSKNWGRFSKGKRNKTYGDQGAGTARRPARG